MHPGRFERRARGLRRALVACAVLFIAPSPADAAGGSKRRPAPADPLYGGDPAKVGPAVDALGARGDRAAVDALAEFLRRGQPDALADRALLALGNTHSHAALSVLAELSHHRRASARRAVYAAVAQIEGEPANELLAQGLRDSDPSVRGVSARGLGERGANSQLELLFRALERGVPEASVAIGRLGDAAAVTRFHAQLGRLPIQVMLGGYEQIIRRNDVDEAVKLEVVARLGEIAGPSVKHFLEQLLLDKEWSRPPRVLRALADTAKRIDDRPRTRDSKP